MGLAGGVGFGGFNGVGSGGRLVVGEVIGVLRGGGALGWVGSPSLEIHWTGECPPRWRFTGLGNLLQDGHSLGGEHPPGWRFPGLDGYPSLEIHRIGECLSG